VASFFARGRALDYRTGRPLPAEPPPAGADVVVPVYGAAEEFARCLDSLARCTDFARHGLIVVLYGPGQDAQGAACEKLRTRLGGDALRVRVNDARRGFVGSVNRGLRESRRDAVLLNSDTEVTPGWLDKLLAAAYSAPGIASVTPFCNDATLVSLPEPFEANRLPAGLDLDAFARLVERASERRYPRLPTGVGVCLYLRRRALDVVGLFDEGFGLGYGEENDFCLRALQAGFVHVLDDATFIWHAGHRSFSAARHALMRRAERRLARRHPRYVATVAEFMREDPLALVRRRVTDALSASQDGVVENPPPCGGFSTTVSRPRRVLHVVHGWPPFASGGTELYAAWLARAQARQRDVAVYARVSDPSRADGDVEELRDGGVRVRLVVNDFRRRDPLARNALRHAALERDFARLLDAWRPDLVHVHHLAGHALTLPGVAAARGVPLVMQVQDWWPACARANLVTGDGDLCPGPGLRRCARCFSLTRLPPLGLPNLALHALRRAWGREAARPARAFVAGSRFVAETWRDWGLLPAGATVHVLPYGVPVPPALAPRPPLGGRPLRFGCLATLMRHKGVDVAVAAFAGVPPEIATLDSWGGSTADPAFAAGVRASAGPSVRVHGPCDEADKPRLLASWDALIVPSIGFESYGLVAREALAVGVPVLSSRLGALNELIDGGGVLGFTAGDAGELRAQVLALAREPARLEALRSEIPRVKSVDEHAEEIERVYAGVMGA
jgi:glycosyltransferase involved in cell wall biosynthesis/GT2 family glycosyltransferase